MRKSEYSSSEYSEKSFWKWLVCLSRNHQQVEDYIDYIYTDLSVQNDEQSKWMSKQW